MKIKVLALMTFKEAARDRVLYLLFFFAAASLIFSRLLALLTVGDRVKIIKDVGLGALSLFGVLMAILMGTSLVYKEIDKKTIFTLLAKPIHRYQFLLGKFFGLVLTLAIILALMSLIFVLVLFLHTFSLDWGLFIAILFIFVELCLITAVAILFSCFTSPILASIFSLAFYLIGHLSWGMEALIRKMKPGLGRSLAQGLDFILPDLENFNFKTEVVYGLPIPGQIYLSAFLYGFVYTVFVLVLAMLIFNKRDFI